MNKLFLLFLSLFIYMQPVDAEDIVKMDRIVAIVNQGVITEQELIKRIRSVKKQFSRTGQTLPPDGVLEKQILERLISDSLQLQYAARTGLSVSENQLNMAIERIAEQNNYTITEFEDALIQDGITMDTFRGDIRNEMIITRLREREIMRRITVTETEIDNLLTTKQASPDALDEYEIAHILIRTPEEAAPEDIQAAKAKAQEAFSALQTGQEFSTVSASFSDAPNALEGGKLGWKKSTELPSLFLEGIKPLTIGEHSEILRSPNGYHILKLTNKRGDNAPLVIKQTHARHILIKLTEIMSDNEAKHKIESLKVRLDNNEDFATLARQFSDDGSANNGGDLGWINPGDTVPPFEKAMDTLTINEISGPVKTQFGWHIIQVLERRDQDMTSQAKRLKAREEIRNRKAGEAYQDWLNELRDRAYVKTKLVDDF